MNVNFLGYYNPNYTYSKLDAVIYQSGTIKKFFLSIVDNNLGNTPDITKDTAYWVIYNSSSDFPNAIDSFITFTNLQATDLINYKRYVELKEKQDRTPAETDEMNSLLNSLRNKIPLAEDFNKLAEAISSVQAFFKSDVDGYITQKQNEFDATISKFTFKGEYNSTVTYQKWNTITYNGESFISKQDNNLNHTPVGDINDAWWFKIAARGAQGPQGIPGTGLRYKGIWNVSTQYFVDDAVQYGGQLFACLQDNIGQEPDPLQQTAYWSLVVAKGSSTKVTMLTNVVTVTDTRTNVPIGIPEFNATTDGLLVIKNSTVWTKGVDYNINANGISIDSLVGVLDGTQNPIEFLFIVWKNMVTDLTFSDGNMIQNETIGDEKLKPDNKVGSLTTLTTTDKTNAVNAINEVNTKVNNNTNQITVLSNDFNTHQAKTIQQGAHGGIAPTALVDSPYTFTRSSVAYKSNGTQVAANIPRFETGKFGQAIMVEEGTTNLVFNPYAKNDLSGISTVGTGSNITITRSTSLPTGSPFTTGVQGTIPTAVADNNLVFYYSNATSELNGVIPVSGNTTYTLSVWLYIPANSNISKLTIRPIEFDSSSNVVKDNTLSPYFTNKGVWQRLAVTFTTQSTTAKVSFRIKAEGDGTFYATGAQFEQKSYATSFIDGTRFSETLTIPTTGVLNPQEGTVEFNFSMVYSPQKFGRLFSWGAYSFNPIVQDCLPIYIGTGWGLNKIGASLYDVISNKNYDFFITLPFTMQIGNKYGLVLTWKLPGYLKLFLYDYSSQTLYSATNNVNASPTFSRGEQAYIGGHPIDGYSNSLIDDLRISSRARTDDEILAAYQSNAPLLPDKDTTWWSGFDTNYNYLNRFPLLGTTNTDINKVKALELKTDTRSVNLTYTNSQLTKVEEKDGTTVVKTTNLTYDANGNLTQVQEIAGGTTITTTLTYTSGTLTSVTKAVS